MTFICSAVATSTGALAPTGTRARLVGNYPNPLNPRTSIQFELVEPGDAEARALGLVTSWAYSFVLDTGLVLAYVKRKHQDAGTTFRRLEQQNLPPVVG